LFAGNRYCLWYCNLPINKYWKRSFLDVTLHYVRTTVTDCSFVVFPRWVFIYLYISLMLRNSIIYIYVAYEDRYTRCMKKGNNLTCYRALINTSIGFLFHIYKDQTFSFQKWHLYGMIAIKMTKCDLIKVIGWIPIFPPLGFKYFSTFRTFSPIFVAHLGNVCHCESSLQACSVVLKCFSYSISM
jgi:hypothetical protein